MSLFHSKKTAPAIIFVVDDELPVLELAKTVISDMGHDVRAFSNPEEALREFETLRPALVLTDYWMPRMSGMDLIRECRRINPSQKTALISGTVDGQIFANAAVKPDRFVAKPYQIKQLMDLVTELLKG